LIDGEHYPSVTRDAVALAGDRGYDVVAALLVGGMEKLRPDEAPDVGVDVLRFDAEASQAVGAALAAVGPDVVLDLSDEPVLGYRERMRVAAVVLEAGAVYEGPDFRFTPPPAATVDGPPSLAVIGTGKRTGKTAIAGAVARLAAARGLAPIIVAMGRGGPPVPELIEPGSVTVESLLALVRDGRHAASDHLEDALTTGVPTVGARRAGGGLAGSPFDSNVVEAVEVAAARRPGLLVLEGSGAAVPPLDWDAGVLVVPATCPLEYLAGYFGPYRLLRTHLAVVTMARSPDLGLDDLPALISHLRAALGDARYVVTEFFPAPLMDVNGRNVFLTTTAPAAVAAAQATHLQAAAGCRVVGWSARLADRAGLAADLDAAPAYDLLLTELKAAAVDVAAAMAMARGADVGFLDNRAEAVEGSVDLTTALNQTIDLAIERGGSR
jgi:cyclic 2,3-diphosphoglycerate synthase